MEQENLSPRYRRPVEMGEVGPLVGRGRTASGNHRERQSTDARHRGGSVRSSDEGPVMGLEPRDRADQGQTEANSSGEEPRTRPEPRVKSFEIPKRLVYEAWEKVRANKGAPGVDAISIAEFASKREGQPLQVVEPDVLGELHAGAGAGGGDTERPWGRGQDPRGAEHGGSSVPDRSGNAAGREA